MNLPELNSSFPLDRALTTDFTLPSTAATSALCGSSCAALSAQATALSNLPGVHPHTPCKSSRREYYPKWLILQHQ